MALKKFQILSIFSALFKIINSFPPNIELIDIDWKNKSSSFKLASKVFINILGVSVVIFFTKSLYANWELLPPKIK